LVGGVIAYAVTRSLLVAITVAAGGPAIEGLARNIAREPGPSASWMSFRLTLLALSAALCLGLGLADGDATLIILGALGLPGACFFLWRRRAQAK
jgi:hypothetical protein